MLKPSVCWQFHLRAETCPLACACVCAVCVCVCCVCVCVCELSQLTGQGRLLSSAMSLPFARSDLSMSRAEHQSMPDSHYPTKTLSAHGNILPQPDCRVDFNLTVSSILAVLDCHFCSCVKVASCQCLHVSRVGYLARRGFHVSSCTAAAI